MTGTKIKETRSPDLFILSKWIEKKKRPAQDDIQQNSYPLNKMSSVLNDKIN